MECIDISKIKCQQAPTSCQLLLTLAVPQPSAQSPRLAPHAIALLLQLPQFLLAASPPPFHMM